MGARDFVGLDLLSAARHGRLCAHEQGMGPAPFRRPTIVRPLVVACRLFQRSSAERGERGAGLDVMGLCPFVAAVAAVLALALPPLASPDSRLRKVRLGPSRPLGVRNWPAPRVPTTVSSPVGSTLTTRTPPPPVTGPTTTTVPKFSSFLAQSADFVTADVGFVLGYLRCGKEVCFALRRTLDRGASWLPLPPPPFNVGAPDDRAQFELHFANTFDGWASGATLWGTDDGAMSSRSTSAAPS